MINSDMCARLWKKGPCSGFCADAENVHYPLVLHALERPTN